MKITCRLYSVIIVLFLISCNTPRYMYGPSAHNVPVLVKAGDSKLSANYSTDLSDDPFEDKSSDYNHNKLNGFDLQGAVAITNNFAIQAQYFNRTERNGSNFDSTAVKYKRKLTEFGIGYYKSMHRRDKVMFQVFGGVGLGTFSFTDNGKYANNVFYLRNHQADVLKIYFQPAFQFRPRENFALSISTRFSIIKFSHVKTNYTQVELEEYRLNNIAINNHAFWEPAFTNTFGFDKLPGVKFEYQFGASLRVSEAPIDHHSFNFSAGIMLDIPKIFQSSSSTDKN